MKVRRNGSECTSISGLMLWLAHQFVKKALLLSLAPFLLFLIFCSSCPLNSCPLLRNYPLEHWQKADLTFHYRTWKIQVPTCSSAPFQQKIGHRHRFGQAEVLSGTWNQKLVACVMRHPCCGSGHIHLLLQQWQ